MMPSSFIKTGLQALQSLSLRLGNSRALEQESAQFITWLNDLCKPLLAILFIRDEDTPETLRWLKGIPEHPIEARMPMGISPWDWLTVQGVPLPPEEAAPRLAFPLTAEGELHGMLCLIPPIALDDDTATVLDIACTLLTTTLRNLQRYHNVEKIVMQRTEALRTSEERYRLISETVTDFVYAASVDENGHIHPEWTTEAFFRMTGYTPQDLLMLDGWAPIIPEEDRERGLARRKRIIEAGKSDTSEFHIRYKDGSLHWIRDYSRPVWDETLGRVVRLYGAAQDITAQKEAQAALERRVEETTALLATARAITSLDLDQVLETIAKRAKMLFQADGSRLHLIEPNGETLRCVTVLEEASGALMAMAIPMGEGFTGQVAASGQARIVNDTEAVGGGIHIPGTPSDSEAMLLAPLRRGERVIGVMTVVRTGTERPFFPHDLEFLEAFAAQAAISIANAQLFEKRNLFAAQMQAINNLAQQLFGIEEPAEVSGHVCRALRTFYPSITEIEISSLDVTKQELTRIYFWQPIEENTKPQKLNFTREYLRIINERQIYTDGAGSLYTPLVIGKRVLGVLRLSLGENPDLLSGEDMLLNVIANLLAAALENTRLFFELRRQLEHIRTLHMVERAVTASVDLRVTLNIILKQIRAHLKADLAAIFLSEYFNQRLPCTTLDGATRTYGNLPQLNTTSPRIQDVLLGQQINTIGNTQELQTIFHPPEWHRQEGIQQAQFIPLIAKGQTRGIMVILYRTLTSPTFDEQEFLQNISQQTALSIEHIRLFEQTQTASLKLNITQREILEHIALLIEEHNGETTGTTLKMVSLGIKLAKQLGMSPEQIQSLQYGLLLHDIGMLLLSGVDVRKNAALTPEEWEQVRRHPIVGAEFITSSEAMRQGVDVVRYHHERYNGSGYPNGLSGEEIPPMARIAAVIDVWYALTSPRPYRPALTEEQALAIIRQQSGKAFDPQVVAAFLQHIQAT